mmetsp:Transcript_83251/g.240536  ORF Transcript_83251/g.240536 Transcript_83251/m.240536 type:complete len:228 (-) Transcript_83251:1017-1700(-)
MHWPNAASLSGISWTGRPPTLEKYDSMSSWSPCFHDGLMETCSCKPMKSSLLGKANMRPEHTRIRWPSHIQSSLCAHIQFSSKSQSRLRVTRASESSQTSFSNCVRFQICNFQYAILHDGYKSCWKLAGISNRTNGKTCTFNGSKPSLMLVFPSGMVVMSVSTTSGYEPTRCSARAKATTCHKYWKSVGSSSCASVTKARLGNSRDTGMACRCGVPAALQSRIASES